MGRLAEGQKLTGVTIRRKCRIGGCVVICPGVEIGKDAYVAAGAVVTKDIPTGTRWMGVPARSVSSQARPQ
jgi:acetyltransferase-like isoleucine patch superfamily enzyme